MISTASFVALNEEGIRNVFQLLKLQCNIDTAFAH